MKFGYKPPTIDPSLTVKLIEANSHFKNSSATGHNPDLNIDFNLESLNSNQSMNELFSKVDKLMPKLAPRYNKRGNFLPQNRDIQALGKMTTLVFDRINSDKLNLES